MGNQGGKLEESSDQDALGLELARAGQAGLQGWARPHVRGMESRPARPTRARRAWQHGQSMCSGGQFNPGSYSVGTINRTSLSAVEIRAPMVPREVACPRRPEDLGSDAASTVRAQARSSGDCISLPQSQYAVSVIIMYMRHEAPVA